MTNGFFLRKISTCYIRNISCNLLVSSGLTLIVKYFFQCFFVVIKNVRNMDNFQTVQIAGILHVYDNNSYSLCYVNDCFAVPFKCFIIYVCNNLR